MREVTLVDLGGDLGFRFEWYQKYKCKCVWKRFTTANKPGGRTRARTMRKFLKTQICPQCKTGKKGDQKEEGVPSDKPIWRNNNQFRKNQKVF